MNTEMSEIDLMALKFGQYAEIDLEDLAKRDWFFTHQSYYWGDTKFQPLHLPKSSFVGPSRETNMIAFLTNDNRGTLHIFSEYLPRNCPKAVVRGRVVAATDIPLSIRCNGLHHGVSSSGWDPEIFVEDADSSLIPAFNFLPHKSSSGSLGAYFDGFAAEFNTPPAGCHEAGMDYVRKGIMAVLISARKKFPKARLSLKTVYRIPEGKLLQTAEEHVALGCNPSLNIYGKPSFFAENPRLMPYRVAGGHVHFGLSLREKEVEGAIRCLDLFAGMVTVALFEGIDDPLRREYYGRAGEYRRTWYGIEYRTLSNAWLGDPRISHLIMEVARQSLGLKSFPALHSEMGISLERVQEIINFCDVKGARTFLNDNKPIFDQVMFSRIPECFAPKFWEIVNEGVLSKFPDFTNVERNWELDRHWGAYNDNHRVNWKGYCNGSAIYK